MPADGAQPGARASPRDGMAVASTRSMRPAPRRLAPALLVIAVPMAVSCATPGPLVSLYPKSPNVVWVEGRAAVTREEGGVRVAVAFDHRDGPNLALRVEVENGTDQSLDVDPHQLTFTTCIGDLISSCRPTQRVIDPEQVLTALEVSGS